jgi:hypothetical protein
VGSSEDIEELEEQRNHLNGNLKTNYEDLARKDSSDESSFEIEGSSKTYKSLVTDYRILQET